MILLGIVLMIVFFLLFSLSSQKSQSKLEKELNAVVADALQTTNLNYGVQLCLKQTLEHGLELLGQQGGNIYTYQGGPVPLAATDYFPVYNYSNITFGVADIPQEPYPNPPQYPFSGNLFPSVPNPEPNQLPPKYYWGTYWPYFGWMHLPYLCQPGGPNDVSINSRVTAPCETGFYGKLSMQEQLERYTENNIQSCTNFSYFKSTTQYEIFVEKPNVSITFGIANIFVNTTYPIELTQGNDKAIKKLSFQSILPVRLRKFYTYLSSLLTLDTAYINFSTTRDYPALIASWDPYLSVQKYCPYCSEGIYTDVLKVTDTGSDLSGKPFIFLTAIRNRRPALDYIHPYSWASNPQVDIIGYATNTVQIVPKGYDADEDQLTYSYRKWKEEYDEVFDSDCCAKDFANCKKSLFTSCITKVQTVPAIRWSTSSLYARTGKDAELLTTEKDIGFHTTQVIVEDDAHAQDYQDVGVLVLPSHLGSYGCTDSCTPDCVLNCACDTAYGSQPQCAGVNLDDLDAAAGHCDTASNMYCKDCGVVNQNTDSNACLCADKFWITSGYDLGASLQGCCNTAQACIKPNNNQCMQVGTAQDKHFCDGSSGRPGILTCTAARNCDVVGSSPGFWCDGNAQLWRSLPKDTTVCR